LNKRVLCLTVGTGIGEDKEKRIYNLAHGLLSSIVHYRPDQILFFGSELSRDTTKKELEDQYNKEYKSPLPNNEFLIFQNIDNLEHCVSEMRKHIKNYENDEIIIDYTSGTKTMTTSAAIVSIMFKAKLTLVSGRRGSNGLVQINTEEIHEQNLFHIFDELEIMKMKELINNYQFSAALKILGNIKSLTPEDFNYYENLISGLKAWDQFDHERGLSFFKNITSKFSEIKAHLGKINSGQNNKDLHYYIRILIDLLNNAERRIEEGKNDDSVARLYRIMELIAQTRLSIQYKITTSDVKVEILRAHELEQEDIDCLKIEGQESDNIKIGMAKSYELLSLLNDPVGELYNNQIMDAMKKRNNSILAHGLEPLNQDETKKIFDLVFNCFNEFINIVLKDDDKKQKVQQELTNCKFPKIED
jgi:CRISPR-associated protein (TIGR02710 family)